MFAYILWTHFKITNMCECVKFLSIFEGGIFLLDQSLCVPVFTVNFFFLGGIQNLYIGDKVISRVLIEGYFNFQLEPMFETNIIPCSNSKCQSINVTFEAILNWR